VKHCRWTVWW